MTKINCLISATEIDEQVVRLGNEITRFYDGKPITVISVLSGSLLFVADLIRQLPGSNIQIGFIGIESYEGMERKGLRITSGLCVDVKNKTVLLVDDILDSGKTLELVKAHVLSCGADRVESCVLIRKESSPVHANFVGFDNFGDHFVIGMGLDYNGFYRNLPYIGVLAEQSA